MPAGSIDKGQDECAQIEEFFVSYPSFSGLLLKELDFVNKKTQLNMNSFVEKNDNNEMFMFVYENQRRVLLPIPTAWSTDCLGAADRGALSDETGIRAFPFESVASAVVSVKGYVFDGKWELDKQYTDTDSEGWSYGINFEYIMSNYRRGKSTTSSSGRVAR